jgi:predicted dehydrogenase
MLKIGVVGLGKMGLLHAGILNALPSCEITSIAEKESLLVKFAKKLIPNLKFYPTIVEMMAGENELDAIYVTTPISTHLPIMQEIVAKQKKLGVFVEKPLAGNYADAKRIVDLSIGFGPQTMVGFQKRFSPIFQRAKQMLELGVIGEANSFSSHSYVSGVFSEGKGWRFSPNQGGALLDLGPHLFDLLLWYFGEPSRVAGSTRSIYSREVDDFAEGTVGFKSGLVGSFTISWSIEGYRLPEIGIEVNGSNGRLKVTDDYLEIEVSSDKSGTKAGRYYSQKPEFNTSVDFLIGDPEYAFEDKYFVNCVSKGKSPIPDFRSGLIVNEVIDRVRSSAKIGGVV